MDTAPTFLGVPVPVPDIRPLPIETEAAAEERRMQLREIQGHLLESHRLLCRAKGKLSKVVVDALTFNAATEAEMELSILIGYVEGEVEK